MRYLIKDEGLTFISSNLKETNIVSFVGDRVVFRYLEEPTIIPFAQSINKQKFERKLEQLLKIYSTRHYGEE